MFDPITRIEQVPRVGQGYERLTLDMKGGPGAYRRFDQGSRIGWNEYEMSKDVAAFANASGGTILIGAEEDTARGICTAHSPFSDELATEFAGAFTTAIEKGCHPRPLLAIERIRFTSGLMLSINVWPFPGQPIGVAVTTQKKDSGYGGTSYVFPIRLVTKTDYLTPEQLPMYMSADVRRRAILLSTIKRTADSRTSRIFVHPEIVTAQDEHVGAFEVYFESLDELGNTLVVTLDSRGVSLPLDAVRAVWRDSGGYHMVIDRRLFNERRR